MSELSKRLCEIANIKPVYEYEVEITSMTRNIITRETKLDKRKVTTRDKTHIVNYRVFNSKPKVIKVKKVYPNFETNAENFVKLFNLKINHPCYSNMVEMIANCHNCFYTNSRELIQNVIECVEGDFNAGDIIQALQQQKWSV